MLLTGEETVSAPEIPALIPNAPLRELVLPFARRRLSILVLQDPWATLAADGDDPQQDAYWGELWPSAVALADAILDGSVALPAGPEPILDLGCGSGLAALAAAAVARPEQRVIAADREPRALVLAQENARRNGLAERVGTVRLDWTKPYAGRHRLILAADCLYRSEANAQLAVFLRSALCSEPEARARAIVVDPDRLTARNFSYVARAAGFEVRIYVRPVPFIAEQGPVRDLNAPPRHAAALGPPEATFYELTLP